jgi:hypothetical protein
MEVNQMLKVLGHIYSDSTEKLKILANAMENEGFTIAYENQINATVIQEVPDEEEPNE